MKTLTPYILLGLVVYYLLSWDMEGATAWIFAIFLWSDNNRYRRQMEKINDLTEKKLEELRYREVNSDKPKESQDIAAKVEEDGSIYEINVFPARVGFERQASWQGHCNRGEGSYPLRCRQQCRLCKETQEEKDTSFHHKNN